MLEELHIENYVLFGRTTLEFGPGLNVISGETGAGKSLVAQALSLALGARSGADAIRAGQEQALVSAVFSLPNPFVRERLSGFGITPDDDGRLYLSRIIRRNGRSRMSVCDRPASVNTVRELAAVMVDMAAQNECSMLADCRYQRHLLDLFGRTGGEVSAYAAAFRQAASLAQRLAATDEQRLQVQARLAAVNSDLDLLDAIAPDPQVDAELAARIEVLSNSEQILQVCSRGVSQLYDADGAVQDIVAAIQREAADLGEQCPGLRQAARALDEVLVHTGDAVQHFRDVAEAMECSPGELEAAIERMEALRAAARRLGCEVEELAGIREARRSEREELEGWSADTGEVKIALREKLEQVIGAGSALSAKRRKAATRLMRAVSRELRELGMEQAGFKIEIRPLWQDGDEPGEILQKCTEAGMEEVAFLVTPNPGEPASTLQETASGGESSRTMLAIKSALSTVHTPLLLFFDEIDTAIGGRLGDVVGRKLKALAQTTQVIAITHLPQIAALADKHVKIAKSVHGGRTLAEARVLEGDERLDEVAQMIHGESRTEITRRQAREMLEK